MEDKNEEVKVVDIESGLDELQAGLDEISPSINGDFNNYTTINFGRHQKWIFTSDIKECLRDLRTLNPLNHFAIFIGLVFICGMAMGLFISHPKSISRLFLIWEGSIWGCLIGMGLFFYYQAHRNIKRILESFLIYKD
jgi:hypothetical protein